MGALLGVARLRTLFLAGVVVLLLGAMSLVAVKWVRVKMLPFDNKSELQVIVDMPEGTTLEQTDRATQALADGDPDPAGGDQLPDLRRHLGAVQLQRPGPPLLPAPGQQRRRYPGQLRGQGRALGTEPRDRDRIRDQIAPIAERYGAKIKVAEVPPGPPVLETLVAEIYGPSYDRQIEIAKQVRGLMEATKGVVDVDWYVEDDQPKYRFVVDAEKAALDGVSEAEIVRTLALAAGGEPQGLLHAERETEDVAIVLRLDRATRSDLSRLLGVKIAGRGGNLVSIGDVPVAPAAVPAAPAAVPAVPAVVPPVPTVPVRPAVPAAPAAVPAAPPVAPVAPQTPAAQPAVAAPTSAQALTFEPVTVSGRQIMRGGNPYIIHGVTVSTAHPGDGRQNVHFTLSYIGGEDTIRKMREMGINSVRTYYPPSRDLLDAMARNGMTVTVGFANIDDRYVSADEKFDIQSGRYLQYINQYKNHPAILQWELGNEYNYMQKEHPDWFPGGWYPMLRNAVSRVRAIDPNHPATTSQGGNELD